MSKKIGFTLTIALLTIASVSTYAQEIARLAPADAVLLIGTDNFSQLRDNFHRTSTYGLYTDPTMAAFTEEFQRRLRESLEEKLTEVLGELPDEIPWPQGQAALAIRLIEGTRTITTWPEDIDFSQFETEEDWLAAESMMVEQEVPTMLPSMVIWADMGDNLQALQEIIDDCLNSAVDQGAVIERQQFNNTEITTLMPAPDQTSSPSENPFESLSYTFVGNTVFLSNDLDFLQQTLQRNAGIGQPGMAADENYQRIMHRVGPGNIIAYANIRLFYSMMATEFAMGADPAEFERVMEATGFNDLNGLGMAVNVGVSPAEEMTVKAMLGVDQPRRGMLAVLTPISSNVRLNRLLTAGLQSFMLANYDLTSIYDNMVELLTSMYADENFNPVQMLEGMFAMTGDPARDLPPVNLRDDILAPLTWPFVFTSRLQHDNDEPTSQQGMAIAVRDGTLLENALRRVHSIMIARGDPELRRDFLNTTIYLINLPEGAMPMFTGPAGPDSDGETQMAFAVTQDYFIMGSVPMVEQSIRDLQRDDLESIATDEMFQYAQRFLPSRAGVVFYQNDRLTSEVSWQQMKDLTFDDEDFSPEDFAMMMGSPSPDMIYRMLTQFCDTTLLPDFDAVQDYFGATVGHLISIDEGLYGEITSLNGPEFSQRDN
ncbi:MAG: hypothetical protein JW936_07545 [Sedimentisphaerales bacterium]|nr:hypothetical protein [Sedimentisphaerales bacterium]